MENIEGLYDILSVLERLGLFNNYENFTETYVRDLNFTSLPPSIKVTWGATKFVIISRELPYVIKIPFINYEHYLKSELNIYSLAFDEGLEIYFAKTIFVNIFNGYPIYIQKKLICNYTDYCSYMSDYLENYSGLELTVIEIIERVNDPTSNDIVYGLLNIDHDMGEKLRKFLFDNNIIDLNLDNFATDGDQIVMIDYPALF